MHKRILFLGAAKRVSLIEHFFSAAKQLAISLDCFSLEKENKKYAISNFAKILTAPSFDSPDFFNSLEYLTKKEKIDIIIPNIDPATTVLAEFSRHCRRNIWCVVSELELCTTMFNKTTAQHFFTLHNIPTPQNTPHVFPKIFKPIHGSGACGITIANTQKEYTSLLERKLKSHIVQDYIPWKEYTVDIYFDKNSKLIGYNIRERIEVESGEVMVAQSIQPRQVEDDLIHQIAKLGKWQGCITLQYFRNDDDLLVIEINPRFGGGATLSIASGLNMPLYILQQSIGLEITTPGKMKNLLMCRARRDFFFEA